MNRTLRAILTPAILLAILLCGGCKTGSDLVLPNQSSASYVTVT